VDKIFKIIVSVVLVILLALGGVTSFLLFNMMNNKDNESNAAEETTVVTIPAKELEVVAIDDAITANIVDEKGKAHILRVSLSLELHTKDKTYAEVSSTLSNNVVIVRDEIINILRSQTYEMMMKNDAPEKLREEIQVRLNNKLNVTAIKTVFFGDFFVQ
jgi:flagellar basal body-associated protein FliL